MLIKFNFKECKLAEITGAEILIKSLLNEGVDTIFGYPGGSVITIFDMMYKTKNLHFYLTRHEQAAAHAADGYFRSTGKVGVCIATSGPGGTNLVTGIATAYMDSIPMVAITGQVATHLIGNDAFQEANITGITFPITKHNYLVKDIKNLSRTIKEAFYIASTGRPGPVLIDLPVDVTKSTANFKYPEKVDIRSYKPNYDGNIKQIKKAVELINKSKKPIIYSGGGVIISNASEELREFIKITEIPITSTLLGLGAYPGNDDLFLGMLGMHGTQYANYAISDSDLIIAIGARFDDRVTGKLSEFAPHAKIIHIDIDPSSIDKSIEVDIPIVGDVKRVLKAMNPLLSKCNIDNWKNHINDLRNKHPLTYNKNEKSTILPQYVIEELYDITKGNSIICTEVGQNQMWTAQFYKFNNPRTLLSSGGLGTMGYGFPAAIGAQIGNPDKTVIDIAGDGSIQMNIQELSTIANYNLPVKIIILNNGYLGMVRQWQELFFDKRYAGTSLAFGVPNKAAHPEHPNTEFSSIPDFVKLAEAYGVKGYYVTKKKDVRNVLEETINYKGPVLVDFRIKPDENVLPMVPAGSPLTKMLA